MPNQTTALAFAPPAEALHELEYQALIDALSESARGRAFLAEHTRRTRAAETSTLLAALERIEALVRMQGASAAAHPARTELQALLDDLRAARPTVEISPLPTKAAQLTALLDLLESRLAEVLESRHDAAETDGATPGDKTRLSAEERPRIRWTDAPPDTLALEADAFTDSDETEEESQPASMSAAPVTPRKGDDLSSSAASSNDLLGFIMALSEEERIALFT